MNYSQALDKAKTLLQQKHYAQAVQAAASALENQLVELYNELLGQFPPVTRLKVRQVLLAQDWLNNRAEYLTKL